MLPPGGLLGRGPDVRPRGAVDTAIDAPLLAARVYARRLAAGDVVLYAAARMAETAEADVIVEAWRLAPEVFGLGDRPHPDAGVVRRMLAALRHEALIDGGCQVLPTGRSRLAAALGRVA